MPTRKQLLIERIVEVSRVLGSSVHPLFYEDYDEEVLEEELESLEQLLDEET